MRSYKHLSTIVVGLCSLLVATGFSGIVLMSRLDHPTAATIHRRVYLIAQQTGTGSSSVSSVNSSVISTASSSVTSSSVTPVSTSNVTVTLTRLFIGEFDNTKYAFTISVAGGFRSVAVKRLDGAAFASYGSATTIFGAGSESAVGCIPFTRASPSVTITPADFPIVAVGTDCSGATFTARVDTPPSLGNANNTTLIVERVSPGQYSNTKYKFTLSDTDGVKKFLILRMDHYPPSTYSSNPFPWVVDPFGCPLAVTSDTVTLDASDFPIMAWVTDCAGNASGVMAEMPPLPAGGSSSSTPLPMVTINSMSQYFGPNFYTVSVKGVSKVGRIMVYTRDGSPWVGWGGYCLDLPTIPVSLYLDKPEYPLRVSVWNCSTDAVSSTVNVSETGENTSASPPASPATIPPSDAALPVVTWKALPQYSTPNTVAMRITDPYGIDSFKIYKRDGSVLNAQGFSHRGNCTGPTPSRSDVFIMQSTSSDFPLHVVGRHCLADRDYTFDIPGTAAVGPSTQSSASSSSSLSSSSSSAPRSATGSTVSSLTLSSRSGTGTTASSVPSVSAAFALPSSFQQTTLSGSLKHAASLPRSAASEAIVVRSLAPSMTDTPAALDNAYGQIAATIATGAENAENSDFVARMKEKGYKTQDLMFMKQIDPGLLSEYFRYNADKHGADIVQVAVNASVNAGDLERLMSAKNDLIHQIVGLREQVKALKQSVRSILQKIQDYTFNPALSKEVAVLVGGAPTMTAARLDAAFQMLVTKSRGLNVRDGITAFEDVDPFSGGDWYAGYVKAAARQNYIRGVDDQKKRFAPEQPADIAQVVTVFGRVLGADDTAEPLSTIGKNMPLWARLAAATVDRALQEHELTLDDVFAGHPSNGATRAQVTTIIATLFDKYLPASDPEAAIRYTDLRGVPRDVQQDIRRVSSAGIMRGSGDLFDPNGTMNRAQFAAILGRLLSIINAGNETTTTEETATGAIRTIGTTAGSSWAVVHEAASGDASSASSEVGSFSSSVAPVFHLNLVTPDDVEKILALVVQWDTAHPLNKHSGLVSDIERTLRVVQEQFALDAKIYPSIALTKNLRNQFLEPQVTMLKTILNEEGQPAD